jgi:hypothetical protein
LAILFADSSTISGGFLLLPKRSRETGTDSDLFQERKTPFYFLKYDIRPEARRRDKCRTPEVTYVCGGDE